MLLQSRKLFKDAAAAGETVFTPCTLCRNRLNISTSNSRGQKSTAAASRRFSHAVCCCTLEYFPVNNLQFMYFWYVMVMVLRWGANDSCSQLNDYVKMSVKMLVPHRSCGRVRLPVNELTSLCSSQMYLMFEQVFPQVF